MFQARIERICQRGCSLDRSARDRDQFRKDASGLAFDRTFLTGLSSKGRGRNGQAGNDHIATTRQRVNISHARTFRATDCCHFASRSSQVATFCWTISPTCFFGPRIGSPTISCRSLRRESAPKLGPNCGRSSNVRSQIAATPPKSDTTGHSHSASRPAG